MIIALTGTPGTGKTSVAEVLKNKGFEIVDLNDVVVENNFIIGFDDIRKSKIVDINCLNNFVKDNYLKKDIIILEGHISHLLKNIDKIIVLRCHPNILTKRLSKKGWSEEKIKENIEAEILDIILCEALETLNDKNVFEINTTKMSKKNVASSILEILNNEFNQVDKYKIGNIDWSKEMFNWF